MKVKKEDRWYTISRTIQCDPKWTTDEVKDAIREYFIRYHDFKPFTEVKVMHEGSATQPATLWAEITLDYMTYTGYSRESFEDWVEEQIASKTFVVSGVTYSYNGDDEYKVFFNTNSEEEWQTFKEFAELYAHGKIPRGIVKNLCTYTVGDELNKLSNCCCCCADDENR